MGIILKTPLCECTAHKWLMQLGWRLTKLKKGVYMDGHECPDVVAYCHDIFLPEMEKYEALMAKYKEPEMKRVSPSLHGDKKEIIPVF